VSDGVGAHRRLALSRINSSTPGRDLDPEADPWVVLGEQLRILREEAGFTTQAALGARISYGPDAVSKVETGDRLPTDTMYPAWLEACGATAREKRLMDKQLALARKAKGPIPQFFEMYIEREKEATFLRLWGLLLIPGPLQVYDYAYAMYVLGGKDEDQAAESAAARIDRQAILEGPDATHVTALIYDFALHLLVGTPETMVRQLEHLVEMSYRRNVVVQVVREPRYFPGMRGQFEIASGARIADTVAMVTVQDHVSDEGDVTRKAAVLFDRIRGYALPVEESRAVIQEAIQRWSSQQQ
jgi:transcriptional regulator with XRE-family HTH domain